MCAMLRVCATRCPHQTTERSLVVLLRALLMVSVTVIAASVVVMELSDASFKMAVNQEESVHAEGNLAHLNSVGGVSCACVSPETVLGGCCAQWWVRSGGFQCATAATDAGLGG